MSHNLRHTTRPTVQVQVQELQGRKHVLLLENEVLETIKGPFSKCKGQGISVYI